MLHKYFSLAEELKILNIPLSIHKLVLMYHQEITCSQLFDGKKDAY